MSEKADAITHLNRLIDRLRELNSPASHNLQAIISPPAQLSIRQITHLHAFADELISALEEEARLGA